MPHRPRTRSFGPRPDEGDDSPVEEDTSNRLPRWGAAAVVAILMAFAASETLAISPPTETTAAQRLIEHRAAAETLIDAAAVWDSQTGVVTIETAAGMVRLAAGEPGDLAAIADWACSGDATLGIYRPSTNNWFTFDSWQPDAVSTVSVLDGEAGITPVLDVRVDANGCASPRIS